MSHLPLVFQLLSVHRHWAGAAGRFLEPSIPGCSFLVLTWLNNYHIFLPGRFCSFLTLYWKYVAVGYMDTENTWSQIVLSKDIFIYIIYTKVVNIFNMSIHSPLYTTMHIRLVTTATLWSGLLIQRYLQKKKPLSLQVTFGIGLILKNLRFKCILQQNMIQAAELGVRVEPGPAVSEPPPGKELQWELKKPEWN